MELVCHCSFCSIVEERRDGEEELGTVMRMVVFCYRTT